MDAAAAAERLDGAVTAEPATVSETGDSVTAAEFEAIVRSCLADLGGVMLFRLRVGTGVGCRHEAAAAIGDQDQRQFLVLSMPVAGGPLKAEAASTSHSPVARIAASYAHLADVLAVA